MKLKLTQLKNTLLDPRFINYTIIVTIFLTMFLLIQTNAVNRYIYNLLIMVLIMIVMSTSLNIATGFLGELVLGHAGFMGIGAYTAAILGIALRPYIATDLLLFGASATGAMILAGIAGLLVGTPALRLRGDYLGIMTLGFGEIVRNLITNLSSITNGAQGLSGIPRIMTFSIAFWTTVMIVTIIFLFMNSRHGRAILSIREDEIASESVGINITRYKLLAFVLASMFAGIGGAMFAFKDGFLAPNSFNFLKSVEIFVIVVLGGMGSLSGSIISSIVLVFLPEYLRDFNQYRYLLYSSVLIIIMLYRPQGLMGTKEFDFTKIKAKLTTLVTTIKKRLKKGRE
ncbi:MAG: branched-chain amino acid ABC transporter permease [Candidatus Izimaplasma sp.]|nr:branched-chain amino acid ABC transporter permease [Candidatus Izimaplasma bacterium]